MNPLPYDPARGIPPPEKKIRQRLGAAMMVFVQWITRQGHREMDDVRNIGSRLPQSKALRARISRRWFHGK